MSDLLEMARNLRPYIEQAVQNLPDADGLKAKALYPCWEVLVKKGSVEAEAGSASPTTDTSTSAPTKTPPSKQIGFPETGLPLYMSALMNLTQGRWQTQSPMTEIWN